MPVLPKLKRYLKIRVTTSDPARFLSAIAENRVDILSVEWVDLLCFIGVISYRDYQKLQNLQHNYGGKTEIVQKIGLSWYFHMLAGRPVMGVGMLLFLLLSLSLPSRILFVRTEGNVAIPDAMLLEQAANCGIKFGSKSKDVRSEKVKNSLLSENRTLQWVGVDFSGCVATIHVRERSLVEQNENNRGVNSVVAGYDGVVSKITVLNGTALCQVGEQVNTGDTLISGYTDCGLKVQAGSASGEVFAYTLRPVSAILPESFAKNGTANAMHHCICLKIGKKQINLCNHSGILYATCDKMYVEKYWTLPGGFRLPVSIVVVTCTGYEMKPADVDYDFAMQSLKDFSEE